MNKYEIESNDSEEDENVPENEVNPTNLADMQIQDAELSENEVFLFGYSFYFRVKTLVFNALRVFR